MIFMSGMQQFLEVMILSMAAHQLAREKDI